MIIFFLAFINELIDEEWDIMVDLFYYKTVEDQEKNEKMEDRPKIEEEGKDEREWDANKNKEDDDDAWDQQMES